MWVTSGGREVDMGGRGPTAKTMHRTVRLSALPHFGLQTLVWWKLLVLTGKKLAFKFSTYIFEYRPLPPLCPPRIHSRDECSQAFPVLIFVDLPILCISVNANRRSKWGRPGNEAKQLQDFNTSTSPRIQACDTRPFPRERVGSGHETIHIRASMFATP